MVAITTYVDVDTIMISVCFDYKLAVYPRNFTYHDNVFCFFSVCITCMESCTTNMWMHSWICALPFALSH